MSVGPAHTATRSHFKYIRNTSVSAATAGTEGAEGRHRATTGHTSTPHAHAGRRDPSWIRGARARAYVAPPDPGPPRALRIRPARPLRALRACARRLRASMPPPRRRPAPRWPVICMQIYSGVSCTSYTLTVIDPKCSTDKSSQTPGLCVKPSQIQSRSVESPSNTAKYQQSKFS